VVLLLIKNGFPDRQRDMSGGSLLHLAAQNGHANVTAVLLSRGASVHDCDDSGWTPLHSAAKLGYRDVAQQLLRRGGDPRGITRQRADEPQAARRPVDPPLVLAAREGHSDVVALLLDKGADVGDEGLHEATSLHVAAAAGHTAVVELLLEGHGGHKALWLADADGNTALHLAVTAGHTAVAAALLARGADVHARDNDGKTPVDLAAGDEQMLAVLSPHQEL
jgi:ankyrin repeat protein